MIYWAPFLHFYQPPTQFHAVLKKICKESYRPLLKLFLSHPQARVTVNICGSLTELFMDHGGEDIVRGLKKLAQRGQLEFAGSAKYHPILPLIPEEEIRRQIELNQRTNQFFFKEAYKPQGFFPPEMCYSKKIATPIAEAGFKWILISGVACNKAWPMDKIYLLKTDGSDLPVLFRDDILSNRISFHGTNSRGFLEHLNSLYRGQQGDRGNPKKEIYVITAMDAETFGHHIQNWEKLFLQQVYEALAVTPKTFKGIRQRLSLAKGHKAILDEAEIKHIKVVTISELLELFPRAEAIEPRPSSWSTSEKDIEHNNFYPLWNAPDNPIHRYQWEHLNVCIELVEKSDHSASATEQSRPYADMARGLLDRALHSCQWWWASKKPMWDINMINKGLAIQEEVIFNAYKAVTLSNLEDTEKRSCYAKVKTAQNITDKIRDLLYTG